MMASGVTLLPCCSLRCFFRRRPPPFWRLPWTPFGRISFGLGHCQCELVLERDQSLSTKGGRELVWRGVREQTNVGRHSSFTLYVIHPVPRSPSFHPNHAIMPHFNRAAFLIVPHFFLPAQRPPPSARPPTPSSDRVWYIPLRGSVFVSQKQPRASPAQFAKCVRQTEIDQNSCPPLLISLD